MKLKQNIIIEIPNPCHESWDQMTPDATGRFCNNCQKSVIDFTLWNDAQLYQFFSRETRQVCGRFYMSQMNRTISIPPQPHRRLYRIAVALGLTLLFTHGGEGKTFAREPIVVASFIGPLTTQTDTISKKDTTGISGVVLDKRTKEPLVNASIVIKQNDVQISGAVSDFDGNFLIRDLKPGIYDITVSYVGYTTQVKTGVIVTQNEITRLQIVIPGEQQRPMSGIIVGYKKPLVDKYQPSKTTIKEDQIKHYPH